MSSFNPIIALQRGLQVLEVVNRSKAVSIKSIFEQTGLHKATIVRMLETLIDSGYVAKTGRSTYVATGRTFSLSQGYDAASRVGDITGPLLADFRRAIGWPSDVGLYSADGMIVVKTSRDRGPLYFARGSGYRAPVLVTSLGQAYLAFCNVADRTRIIENLAAIADPRNDLARDPGTLERKLAEVRSRGFATMDSSYSSQEYGGKVWGMAVPIRDQSHVYASINLLVLRSACSEEEAIKRYLVPLQQIAGRLGQAIGTETPGTALDESVLGS